LRNLRQTWPFCRLLPIQPGTCQKHKPHTQSGETPTANQDKVLAVAQQQDAEKPEDYAFYVFAASTTEGLRH